jgi:hypothetical protein
MQRAAEREAAARKEVERKEGERRQMERRVGEKEGEAEFYKAGQTKMQQMGREKLQ